MGRTKTSIALTGFDDLFNVGSSHRHGENQNHGEFVVEILLTELNPPDCHPFRINDDEQMTQLVESVKRFGVRELGCKENCRVYKLLCQSFATTDWQGLE